MEADSVKQATPDTRIHMPPAYQELVAWESDRRRGLGTQEQNQDVAEDSSEDKIPSTSGKDQRFQGTRV